MDEREDLVREVARLKAALAEAERRKSVNEAVIEHAPVAIEIFDAQGYAVTLNRAQLDFLGVEDGSVAIGRFNVFQDPGITDEQRAIFARAYQGEVVEGGAFEVDLSTFQSRWPSSSRVAWFETIVFPIRDGAGAVTHVVSFLRDVTGRKQMERAFLEAQRHESLALLSGRIAHDFNNLLVGVLANATLALDNLEDAALVTECLESIARGAEMASALTGQLLGFAGKGRFVEENLDVSRVVREMSGLLEASLPKKIELRLELDDALPAVRADATQLRQVVMNLITNAADAIGDASGSITLRTSAGPAGAADVVRLDVIDTGCGMDEATMKRMFDPFFTTKSKGYGLGLAAALGSVKGAGGTLTVASEKGKGTTMTLRLPALANVMPPPPRMRTPPPVSLIGCILVVDDEPLVRTTIERALRRAGHRVLSAGDGEQGLAVFTQHAREIDVVVVDLNMPVMGGAELVEALAKQRPDLRVLMTSGNDDRSVAVALGRFGKSRFLGKPFRQEALLEEVARLLGSRGP